MASNGHLSSSDLAILEALFKLEAEANAEGWGQVPRFFIFHTELAGRETRLRLRVAPLPEEMWRGAAAPDVLERLAQMIEEVRLCAPVETAGFGIVGERGNRPDEPGWTRLRLAVAVDHMGKPLGVTRLRGGQPRRAMASELQGKVVSALRRLATAAHEGVDGGPEVPEGPTEV